MSLVASYHSPLWPFGIICPKPQLNSSVMMTAGASCNCGEVVDKNTNQPVPSCCGTGGSWSGDCGSSAQVASKAKGHTWADGIQECSGEMTDSNKNHRFI